MGIIGFRRLGGRCQQVAGLGLDDGRDYTATYDSTMGRFWFHSDQARERITALLEAEPNPSGSSAPRCVSVCNCSSSSSSCFCWRLYRLH